MPVHASLLDAVRDLDPLQIETLSGFTLGRGHGRIVARFRFAFYGPSLEGDPSNMEQIPDVEMYLPEDLDVAAELSALSQSDLLGNVRGIQLPPGAKGNPTGAPFWIVRTHAGSQAEWIQWLQSIS